jgi:hypothetical protein
MTTNTHFECAIDGVLDRFPGTPSDPQPPPPDNPTERFPGDPNPLVSGKTFWGSAYLANGNVVPRYETPTGTKLAIHRRYWSSLSDFQSGSGMRTAVTDDHSNNRLPCVSGKFPDWANAAAGGYDTTYLDPFIAFLETQSKPTWLIINHEPENDGASAANFRAMQSHVRSRITAYRNAHPGQPHRIAFGGNLMAFTWNTTSGRNPEDWYPGAGVWDFVGADHYTEATQTITRTNPLGNFLSWAEAKNLPMTFPEWGLRDTDASRATKMQTFYDLINDHDVVGYMYFDSDSNSTAQGWLMDTTLLNKFEALMEVPSSIHLSDLGY